MSEKVKIEAESLEVPERLNEDEIKRIVEKIDDKRLRTDEDLEHFTIHLSAEKIVNVPKREIIHVRSKSGFVQNVKIEDRLRKIIDDYDIEYKKS